VYDYPEPTDEERLEWDIYDDANEPDSTQLLDRQQERWQEFIERNKLTAKRTEEALVKAHTAQGRSPTWWEVWQPPLLNQRKPAPGELFMQGQVTLKSESRMKDVCGYGGVIDRVLVDSYQLWMDFYPRPDGYGMRNSPPFWLIKKLTDEQGRALLSSHLGWWDRDHLRSRIYAYKITADPAVTHITGLAIKAVEPPPYGLWLPAFDFTAAEL
jgi:hypothetical protein